MPSSTPIALSLESSTRFLSSSLLFQTFLVTFILFATLYYILQELFKPPHKKKRQPNGKRYVLPPEPTGSIPIFGHLLQMGPGFTDHLREWPRATGEFTTLTLGSTTWVLLNSSRVAHEILGEHGSVTNDRPDMPVAAGLMGNNMRSVLMRSTPLYREERRMYHQLLNGTALQRYSVSQSLESTQLLAEYLIQPQEWYIHHGRYAHSVINLITFGKRTLQSTPLMRAILEVVYLFTSNGMNVYDLFPILSKLPKPLQWWRNQFVAIGERTQEVYAAYWRGVMKDIKTGIAQPSFTRDVLQEEAGKFHGTEDQAMFLATQLVEAGSDTTRGVLNVLPIAMIRYPDFVARVRAEIEGVCGTNAERLPEFTDEGTLRLVLATCKELLRWRPIFPVTPAHRLDSDLHFEGYFFPEDTRFTLNNTFISSSLDEHEDPERFWPERWLKDGKEAEVLNGVWGFGGGRRVCVGYRLAQRSLFINVARIIYCFDYEKTGEISPDYRFDNHNFGEPFPVRPKIRSEGHAKLVERAAKDLDVWEFANGRFPPAEEEESVSPPNQYILSGLKKRPNVS